MPFASRTNTVLLVLALANDASISVSVGGGVVLLVVVLCVLMRDRSTVTVFGIPALACHSAEPIDHRCGLFM